MGIMAELNAIIGGLALVSVGAVTVKIINYGKEPLPKEFLKPPEVEQSSPRPVLVATPSVQPLQAGRQVKLPENRGHKLYDLMETSGILRLGRLESLQCDDDTCNVLIEPIDEEKLNSKMLSLMAGQPWLADRVLRRDTGSFIEYTFTLDK